MMALTFCAARRLTFSDSEPMKKLAAKLQNWRKHNWVPGEDSRIPAIEMRRLKRCENTVGILLDNGADLGSMHCLPLW